MSRPPVSLATAKPAPVMSAVVQLAFYLFGGILLPAASWSLVRNVGLFEPAMLTVLGQAAIGNLLAWYSLSRLRTYARARLLSYVLPINLVAFGGIFALNALLRQDFSYTLFLSCAAGTLAFSYLVTVRIRHANPQLRHYIVPAGSIGSVLGKQGFVEAHSVEQLEQLVDSGAVFGSIVADLHYDHAPEWERLLAKAALKGIPVYHYRLIEEALTGEVRINHLRENELGSLIPNLPYRTAKRAIDIVAVLILLPILLPVSLMIALLIRLDSDGPSFFIQDRIGFRGQSFQMVKFRTMREREVADSNQARREDAMTKNEDGRITRIGRFLRKTRLDELPQAWNVLVGDMSWIGPRPEARELAEWYETEVPFYSYRHIVRPGITGWAQVNQGHVAALGEIQSKLRLDFYYVKNLSLWLDVLVALKTLRVVLGGIGAR